MKEVHFPQHLIRHFPVPPVCQAGGNTVAALVADLDRQFPGVAAYLIHENGALRQHVNIFLDNRLIRDRQNLSDSLDDVEVVHVMQALSGG